MPYLLRVELPDVPGSLGRVAAAIGEAGGDIEAIEIVEKNLTTRMAVDDVLLETAPGVMPDSIVSACTRLEGVKVLWISRYGAGGNLFLDLEAVETLTATPHSALDELVDLLPITFRADWGVRVRRTDSGIKIMHSTSAAPDIVDGEVDWFPLSRPACVDVPENWERWTSTLVAAAPLGDKDELVLFGRRGGPAILDSELARLGHLAALAVSIAKAG
ncbi:MAG TPA: ACT domain-containing protein [Nocardioidaceae bacterium]|nr:ACT domain-containing protein [Nocardioidaceae bacterium]HSE55524.1 ACT domain-containing protein [Nocardioidaceae bacterium]